MATRRRQSMENDVTVVRFAEPILDAVIMHAKQTQLFAPIEKQGCRKMLLDFHNVRFVSSGALGVLITLQKKMEAAGGTLVLCELAPDILEVLEATKLDRLFRSCRDRSDGALTYFRS